MRVAVEVPESLGWICTAEPADVESYVQVLRWRGEMCDTFISHVNAIINMCADL